MKIKSCEFNIDTACIDITYMDGKILSLYIPTIEDSLRTTVYSRSKLDLMLGNEPLEYARMVLDGTMQGYVDRLDGIGRERMERYTGQLAERYPRNVSEDIAREMLMYE